MPYLRPPSSERSHSSQPTAILANECDIAVYTTTGCEHEEAWSLRYRSHSPSPKIALQPMPTLMYPLENVAVPIEQVPGAVRDAISSRAATPQHNVAAPLHKTPADGAIVEEGFPDIIPQPTSPQNVLQRRYQDRYRIPSEETREDMEMIPEMETSFEHDPIDNDDWRPMEHPEGQLYYQRMDLNIHVYTDVLLQDKTNLSEIEKLATVLSRRLQERKSKLPENLEVVLDVQQTEEGTDYYYYLVDGSKRAIFWLEKVDASLLTLQLRQAYNPSYLILVPYFAFDSKTSETSTSPFNYADLAVLSNSARNLTAGGGAPAIWVVDWERFLHFHGLREARLDRSASVFESTPRVHSWLFRIMTPMLFYLPTRYAEQLNVIWVDQTVNHVPWRNFIDRLARDWQASITPASILVTTNVGLLAVNTIDTNGPRNVAEIASYISTFLSLGNIILCAILMRQHQISGIDTAAGASAYLYKRESLLLGLDIVAIVYSLPEALFLYGSSVWTRLLTGIIFALVVTLVVLVVMLELWPPITDEDVDERGCLGSIRHNLVSRAIRGTSLTQEQEIPNLFVRVAIFTHEN
ncbi:hypothetical protein POSPLADRAFT_1147144 [Postia placenta MAD-698-R-SB12]|uniref:WW domain-containing protein n=1 Tax=Postia placenta MAD-698-R-SB12 TaxID=670580 RepID=A0A1X6MXT7_9APHY|nr:hypothetical protein POSPLADRAFT_1147144 [Postia placenta MAD-698-R-SB12]OSX61062.1 hypothetical protein POSPLADRAFT_1147144 [Postia placenta MAD-698-R-SB12]